MNRTIVASIMIQITTKGLQRFNTLMTGPGDNLITMQGGLVIHSLVWPCFYLSDRVTDDILTVVYSFCL